MARLLPRRFVDLALRAGAYGIRRGPGAALSMKKVEAHPHGLDLGPLQPQLPGRLMTKGKRVRLDHPVVVADVPRVLADLEAEEVRQADPGEHDLLMIGRRHLRSNNSWMHNVPRLTKGRALLTLMVHPADASVRGIADGTTVAVTSRVGSIEVPVQVTDEVMPGVVSLPHGFGHDRPGTGWRHAAGLPGASANDITDATRFDPLSGNAAVQGVPVSVRPAG
jgi:anaerobic selenocysteine-containing dehydrogenase